MALAVIKGLVGQVERLVTKFPQHGMAKMPRPTRNKLCDFSRYNFTWLSRETLKWIYTV